MPEAVPAMPEAVPAPRSYRVRAETTASDVQRCVQGQTTGPRGLQQSDGRGTHQMIYNGVSMYNRACIRDCLNTDRTGRRKQTPVHVWLRHSRSPHVDSQILKCTPRTITRSLAHRRAHAYVRTNAHTTSFRQSFIQRVRLLPTRWRQER